MTTEKKPLPEKKDMLRQLGEEIANDPDMDLDDPLKAIEAAFGYMERAAAISGDKIH